MPNKKILPEKQIADWYVSGQSSFEIAERLQVSPCTILRVLKQLGIKSRTAKEAAVVRKESGRSKPPSYWTGRKQPLDMVENRASKIRGENHYLWKGGKDRRPYRRIKAREICEQCQSKENLGMHHKDFDHFNNSPDNLQVLCVSCHMSLHKQAYWDAIHSGTIPPRSNGKVGWEHKGGDNE